jgi:hypothetical protein
MKALLERLACAVGLGFASAAACASAAPVGPAQAAPLAPLVGPAPAPEQAAKRDTSESPAPGDDAGAPRCPYGALEDPHRGFVRCLQPDERDAGWLPPPPQNAPAPPPPPDAPPDAGASGALPSVEIGAPKFDGGEVTKVEKSLGKASGDLARCVADHGGLLADAGSVKIQFLVRARGRAEGVEVLASKGVSAEAASCVRQTLRNKAIGAPSADPVGVTVTISWKPAR